MPVSFDDIVEACTLVAQQDEINVCVTESLKGAGIAGLGAFTLGVLFGPVGIAVGGAIGGYAGSTMCKKFVPLHRIIGSMSSEDKEKLVNHMRSIIQRLDVSDAVMLAAIVSGSGAGRQVFLQGLQSFAHQIST